MKLLEISQITQCFSIAFATLAGGLWAIYRFISERKFETAIGTEISTKTQQIGKQSLVFVDVAFINKGNRKLEANKIRRKDGFIYADSIENLRHSCSLQIKRIREASKPSDRQIDWYISDDILENIETIPEIDLATEYENPITKRTDFWLEPGETAHLCASFLLSRGDYLLKVTFVGKRKNIDYWSFIHYLHID